MSLSAVYTPKAVKNHDPDVILIPNISGVTTYLSAAYTPKCGDVVYLSNFTWVLGGVTHYGPAVAAVCEGLDPAQSHGDTDWMSFRFRNCNVDVVCAAASAFAAGQGVYYGPTLTTAPASASVPGLAAISSGAASTNGFFIGMCRSTKANATGATVVNVDLNIGTPTPETT